MKRQSILFILVLLQVLFICIGCGSSEKSAQPLAAAAKETAVEEAAPAEASIQEESPEEEILAEQRAWISEKEAKSKEISSEYEGGSMESVDKNEVLAELTMKRCEELIEYLK